MNIEKDVEEGKNIFVFVKDRDGDRVASALDESSEGGMNRVEMRRQRIGDVDQHFGFDPIQDDGEARIVQIIFDKWRTKITFC